MTERHGRSTAEWLSFALSCLVLLVVVGLIAVQLTGPHRPAAPVATQADRAREQDGRFFVPVDVVNEGNRTATNVQVTAELTIAGESTSGDQTIDFLAGDEIEQLTFAFDSDPADGALAIRVTGFAIP